MLEIAQSTNNLCTVELSMRLHSLLNVPVIIDLSIFKSLLLLIFMFQSNQLNIKNNQTKY